MICLLLIELVSFPQKDDAIFESLHEKGEVIATSSGSIGFYKDGKCQQTHPNMTLGKDDKSTDWCSNIAKPNDKIDDKTNGKPWISYRLKNKRIRANSYAIRSGCCYYECCCIDDDTFIDKHCCCTLFSYSLQVSDDNITWRTIHSVEEDHEIKRCTNRDHKFEKVEEFTFVRFVLDKQKPYCENCFALNRFEIYGSAIQDNGIYDINNEDDESVSIIGKIDKNHDN